LQGFFNPSKLQKYNYLVKRKKAAEYHSNFFYEKQKRNKAILPSPVFQSESTQLFSFFIFLQQD